MTTLPRCCGPAKCTCSHWSSVCSDDQRVPVSPSIAWSGVNCGNPCSVLDAAADPPPPAAATFVPLTFGCTTSVACSTTAVPCSGVNVTVTGYVPALADESLIVSVRWPPRYNAPGSDAGAMSTPVALVTVSRPSTSRGWVAASDTVSDPDSPIGVSTCAGATVSAASGTSAYHGTTSAIDGAAPPVQASRIADAMRPSAA